SIVGVNGCHLKGNYGGIFLSIVELEGNNALFPFSCAIVGGEDTKSWKFDIWHINNVLKDGKRWDMRYIISDRQKHLAPKWKQPFLGSFMFILFWKAYGATSPFTSKKAMNRF
ncbi:Inosamine-phosphate amidinotransferase 1, partial [Bienertia sinuspersici]